MDAVSTSVMVLLLIFGLGLSGASYNTCKDTLNSNGYYLTDSQYQSFYESANDPINLQYISLHQSEMSENWAIVTSSGDPLDQSVSNWYSGYISESLIPDSFTVDKAAAEGGIWGDYGGVSSTVTVPQRDLEDIFFQQYGPIGKTISDGHGGYYIGYFISNSNPYSSNVGSYYLDHVLPDGYHSRLYTSFVPRLCTMDTSGIYLSFDLDYNVVENDDGSQTVTVYNTRIQKNAYADLGYVIVNNDYPTVVKFHEDRTSDIEEIKGDDVTLPLNPDGSVTLPDGTMLLPNEDGTITIGGTDYAPKPGVLSPTDLLKQLLDLQEKLKELEDELKWEKEKDRDKELDEAIDEAASEYDGDLMEFVLNSRVTQVFPFCLPFDLVRGIKLFSASPVTPKFEFPVNIPELGLFPGVETTIELDLKDYEMLAVLSRWMSTVSFVFGLITVTFKVVKGSGT